ncbi:MAG TPA: cytochrome-c peroxidase [Geobacteraceae bacterium]
MVKKMLLILVAMSVAAGSAYAATDLRSQAASVFRPIPQKAPAHKGKQTTPELVLLGKMLYFDPRLSASQLISCNTCHNVGLGGVDLQETSIGHGWQKGPRNAPTVLNAVFNIAQFWDGRAEDLKEQAKGPVQASVEMNNSPAQVVATLQSIPGYVTHFKKAFPKEKEPVTFDNMAKAIEAFEATLLTPNAPFDRFLKGDKKALGATEQKGLELFLAKGCGSCHGGVNVGGGGYFPFGVVEKPAADILPPDDRGRFKVTKSERDQYVFRAPSLRNIDLTPPYFHSGKVWKLTDAVSIMGAAQLGAKLSDDETAKIVAFLHTLTGTQPKVEYPILPAGNDNTPKPSTK